MRNSIRMFVSMFSLITLVACGDTFITNVEAPKGTVSVSSNYMDMFMNVGAPTQIEVIHRIPGHSELEASDTLIVSVGDEKTVKATRKQMTHMSYPGGDVTLPFVEVTEVWEVSGLKLGTTRVTFISSVDKKKMLIRLANVL